MSDENTENEAPVEAVAEPAPEMTPEQGLEELRKQLEAEKQARQFEATARLAAERRVEEERARAYVANNEVQDSNLTIINNAIAMVDRDIQIYRGNIEAALQAQDYAAVAEATEGLSDAKAKRLQLANGKEDMERRLREPPPPAPRLAPTDPVEALASQLSPRSANWVRANPQYATNAQLYQSMVAAHNFVVSQGVQPDTDAYFAEIEGLLKVRAPSEPPRDTPRAPPAAPPSRGTGQTARLSADERELASLMGMSDQEYLENKRELQKSGRIH